MDLLKLEVGGGEEDRLGAFPVPCESLVSWDSFCRLLEPRLKNHQIEFPGSGEHIISGSSFIVSSVWGPPSTHRASEGPTRNMRLSDGVSIIMSPPLSHHTLY